MSFRRPARSGAVLLCLALFVWVGRSVAEDAPASQREADERFQEGKALLAQGEVALACQKFEQSLSLLRRGGTLLNLAVCREKQGRYATAMRLFQEALAAATTDKRADREKLARERLAEVRPKLSWIEVKVDPAAPATEGLVITCDDQTIPKDAWGSPMPYDTGSHKVMASAPGRVPFEVSFSLEAPGERRTISIPNLALVPPPEPTVTAAPSVVPTVVPTVTAIATATAVLPPRPTATAETPPPASWRRPTGIAALSVGLASIALGTAFGIKAISDNNRTKDLCPGNVCPTDEGIRANQDAKAAALVSDVALPVGLVAAGAGLFLMLTSRPSPPRQDPARAAVSVTPVVGPQGGSLLIRGAF